MTNIRDYHEELKKGKTTAVELARHALDRVHSHEEVLHAYLHISEERALETAKALDEEASKGRWRSPLHGIPFSS